MWAPTSLIIHLVSVGCGDTFFFTEIGLRCTALICSVISSTWETDLAVKANSPKDTVWSEAPVSCQPVPCWTIWLHWQPDCLRSSSHFPTLTCFGDGKSHSLSILKVAPCSDQFSQGSWCFWAKRNQLRCKEPCVYHSQWFSLPHSFPCGAVKPSLISISTAS